MILALEHYVLDWTNDEWTLNGNGTDNMTRTNHRSLSTIKDGLLKYINLDQYNLWSRCIDDDYNPTFYEYDYDDGIHHHPIYQKWQ